MSHAHGATALDTELLLIIAGVLAVGAYGGAVLREHRRGGSWPWHRPLCWLAGVAASLFAVTGPFAAGAHSDFVLHVGQHMLLGMLAPLLLVLAAPVTLALRSLHPTAARRLSRALKSWPVRVVAHPIPAATLNVGGMWLLYSTPLFEAMNRGALLHAVVMLHFLVAGYLFTAAILAVDRSPHQARFAVRAGVLVLALAAHGILAKVLYADPPAGVPLTEAQTGAQLMYYAGDAIDVAVMVLLCAEWYHRVGRVRARRASRVARGVAVSRPLPPRPDAAAHGPR